MAKTSCVLFDLGGVIVNWHNSWFKKEVSEEFQLEEKRVSAEFDKNLASISTGRIGEREFWHVIGKELESSKLLNLDESLLDKIFRKHVSVNEPMIELSRNLFQKGIPIGILSNTEHVTYSAVSELLSLEHFEHKFLSYKIGHLKPEPEIYKHVIDNMPFPKEEIFFIDDLKSNVESARFEGIDAVQYSNFDDLEKECRLRDIL